MYKMKIVLELLLLFMGMSHSWDLAVSYQNILELYTNDIKTTTIPFNSYIRVLAYDEVHDILLYVGKQSNNDVVCAYIVPSNEYQCFPTRNGRNIHGLTFDPVTELVFFTDVNERSINWINIESERSSNYTHLLVKLDDGIPTDIAVDSCRGYVYWITTNLPTPQIERVRFDGSQREVILYLNSLYTNSYYKLEPHSLVIDQVTQKMYWVEPASTSTYTIYNADLNGENQIAITDVNMFNNTVTNPETNAMAITNNALYMSSTFCPEYEPSIIMKLSMTVYTEESYINISMIENQIMSLTAKTILRDIQFCEAMTCIENKDSVTPYCVNGEKVRGRCLCKCTPGYIGERCDVSVCNNYCLHGYCSVNEDGLPECRCESGYSGERCEINACCGYCKNNGVCYLNEEDEPSCQCVGPYKGSRCEVSRTFYKQLQH